MSLLRGALRRFTLKLLLLQIALGVTACLLATLWLRLPDASALQVAASFVLGLLVLAIATGGQSWISLWLAREERTRRRLLIGAASVIVAVLLWCLLSQWITALHAGDSQRASYLNSRFPHGLRSFFTYKHIYQWLGWLWSLLLWIAAGILAAASYAVIIGRPRAVLRTLVSVTWWVALVLLCILATTVTGIMMDWTPGHGLGVELLSLIVRLGFVVVLDGAVISLLLAILAQTQAIPDGTVEVSQPRTEVIP
jgi:MFS family permease